jgi:hypothetical protein
MQVILWLSFAVSIALLVLCYSRGNKRDAALWGGVALGLLLILVGVYWLLFWPAVVTGITLLIFRQWRAAGIAGGVAVISLTFGAILLQPSASAVTVAQSPNADATPIMEVNPSPYITDAPDPYADCIGDGMSKRHCALVAKAKGYRLTTDDRKLSDWKPAPTATPEPTSTPEPTNTPEPAPTSYEQSVHAQKAEFLQSVDESISGAMIAGNKLKYVGDNVELHCTVESIVDESSFNASCGTDEDGLPAIILVQYDDTSSLDKGQSVRILGTVEDPTEGVNGFGGETTFPTVKAEYME